MTPQSPGVAAAMAMVDEWVRCGVTHAFIAPGSRSSPLAYALSGSDMRLTVCLDERSAAFMALGWAKVSSMPAMVATTSGTAAANLHPAIVEARISGTPMIVVTADRPPELRQTGASQTIDQTKLFGGDVVWFFEPGVPEAAGWTDAYFRSVACRAYAESVAPVGGPVHLNVGFREPLVPSGDGGRPIDPAGGRADGRPWTSTTQVTTHVDDGAIDELAALIGSTDKGLIVAGGVSVGAEIEQLARVTSWPVIADPMSSAKHVPSAVNSYDALLRTAFASSHVPDLVIRVGNHSTSKALAAFVDDGVPQVVVDRPGAWSDPDRTARWMVRGDPGQTIVRLAEKVPPRISSTWMQEWLEADRVAEAAVASVLQSQTSPTEPWIARSLSSLLTPGALLWVASSMPVRDLDWFMTPRSDVRVCANRGANGIDGTIASATGAAKAHSGDAFALCGDLAFLHDQSSLTIDPKSRPDLLIVVVNNRGGGIFSFLPQAEHPAFEHLFGTPHDVDLDALSRAHRIAHALADSKEGFVGAVAQFNQMPGMKVLEVITDRETNVAAHRQIWEAVGAALS